MHAPMHDAPGARDRTQEFIVLRKAAAQQSNWMQGAGAAPHPPARVAARPPSWAAAVTHFGDLEKSVNQRTERLYSLQRDVFAPKFGVDAAVAEEAAQGEVDKLTGEIQRFVKELERLVTGGIRLRAEASPDDVRAAAAVRKHLGTRLTAVLMAFKGAQSSYAEQLAKREEKRKAFRTFGGDSALHERLEREERVSALAEQGHTQAEITELLHMEEHAQAQTQEVLQVAESIRELNQMFEDLKALVVEQGTVLDRIDYNLERTETTVTKGVAELQKARESQKCAVA